VQSVESVCMSIQSMLTGNTKNERPQGDEDFCRSMGVRGTNGWGGRMGRGLKDVRFVYDDATV
jgi:ubiquitin-conjugating enzyme E2 W